MAVTLYHTGTEYIANAVTFTRGSADDVTSVGVYFDVDPNNVPDVTDFTTVTLVQPGDPLAEGTNTDILTLVGARNADVLLTPGDYQLWTLVSTLTEDIIRKVDTVTVL